jgi:hypothetical protein
MFLAKFALLWDKDARLASKPQFRIQPGLGAGCGWVGLASGQIFCGTGGAPAAYRPQR